LALASLLNPNNVGIQLHNKLVATERLVGQSIVLGATAGAGGIVFGTVGVLSSVGAKTVVGFGLGYGGAVASGVKSTEGRLLAGGVGALALPGGSFLIDGAAAVFEEGSVASVLAGTGTGLGVAFVAGGGGELAGQKGDIDAGVRPEGFDIKEAERAGFATLGAYALFGEGALTAVGLAGQLGEGLGVTAAEISASTGTSVGGFGAQKLLHAFFATPENPPK
jgi:hypothetical protein